MARQGRQCDNSTLVSNTASACGGGVEPLTGDVLLQHATIVETSAPVGANLNLAQGLHAFGCWAAASGVVGSGNRGAAL
jgi:hypothetical protein